MDTSFSPDYSTARAKFIDAALTAEAEVTHLQREGQKGPRGEDLFTDIAWLGPRSARQVFVALSGTHGIEGFFGAAVQTEWLRRGEHLRLPSNSAVLLVHAIEPHGFAWQRQVDENNVDLDRNWIDFAKALPENAGYEQLAADLCPADWSIRSQAETGRRLQAWTERHGSAAFQQAVSGGQWMHAQGIFYGGTAPSWSRTTLSRILQSSLVYAHRALIVDFRTGAGRAGCAVPIVHRARSDPGFARTHSWIGASATSLFDAEDASIAHGEMLGALPALLPHIAIDTVSLECGVQSAEKVMTALRADAWLHAHGGPPSTQTAIAVRAQLRAAFHSDDLLWQGMALGQGLSLCRAALGEMGSGSFV